MSDYYIPRKPSDYILDYIRYNYVYRDGRVFGRFSGREKGSASHPYGYKRIRVSDTNYQQRLFLAHHIVWFLCRGEWPASMLNHVDGNPLNNKIENLEPSYNADNTIKGRLYSKRKAGFRLAFVRVERISWRKFKLTTRKYT